MVGPIPEVSFVGFQVHYIRTPSIYWPNLTRLELTTSINAYDFLCSIDCMPHLLHLRLIIICLPNEYDIKESGEDTDSSYSALSRLSDLKESEQSRSKLATLTIDWFTVDAYKWHVDYTVVLQPGIDEDPRLEEFFQRVPTLQTKSSSSLDFDDYSHDSNYDSTDHPGDDATRCFNRPNREKPMEDAEAEAALRAYLPNLVGTKFAKMTRD